MIGSSTTLIARTRAVRRYGLALIAPAVLLAGCDKEPVGQVLAVVDGDEITLQDVNAELSGVQIPDGADVTQVRKAALERIIERKIMAGVARDAKVDQSPEFILRSRQLEDALLVQLLTQQAARSVKVPVASEVNKFIADNPQMFADRAFFALDQISFPMPAQASTLEQLKPAKTMAEVVAVLDRLGIRYQRQNARMDTAAVPVPTLDQIRRVPEGEPFVLPTPAAVTVNLITGQAPAPLGGDEARQLATAQLRNAALADTMRQRMNAKRAQIEVEYQPEYRPDPRTTPTPAASRTAGAAADEV